MRLTGGVVSRLVGDVGGITPLVNLDEFIVSFRLRILLRTTTRRGDTLEDVSETAQALSDTHEVAASASLIDRGYWGYVHSRRGL